MYGHNVQAGAVQQAQLWTTVWWLFKVSLAPFPA